MPAKMELMRMEYRVDGMLLRLTCRCLDQKNASEFADTVLGCVPEGACGNLYLDLGSVEYISAAAIGQLVLLNREVQIADGTFVLLHVAPFLRHLLQTCGLTELLNVPGTAVLEEDLALRSGFSSTVVSSILI